MVRYGSNQVVLGDVWCVCMYDAGLRIWTLSEEIGKSLKCFTG